MGMTTGEPAPFSQGCGACGMGCWQDLLLHKGKEAKQSAGSLRAGQEDVQCKRWRDGKKHGVTER